MSEIKLKLTEMAHGGAAMGRDERGQVIFVPYAIPGEEVVVEVDRSNKKNYANGKLVKVLRPSSERVSPPCEYFGVCGGCHFQHIDYEAQLTYKQQVVAEQLARIGGLKRATVRPTLPNSEPYYYRAETTLNRPPEGGLGYWSPVLRQVIPVATCYIIQPPLRELLEDIDIDLPGLRKLSLRVGDDEAMLAAMEVDNVEPPSLQTDFPVSVSIVLPDGTAANLVGDNYVVQAVKGRDFRVSAGVAFHPTPAATALLVDTVLKYAALRGAEYVLEGYSGAGMLTAFLAEGATSVIGIEQNPDAVADAVVNLDESDNIIFYEGTIEDILPELDIWPDLIVVDPPAGGLETAVWRALQQFKPDRFIYSSSDAATMARDAKKLAKAGYRLIEVQPIDMFPQNFQVQTVSLWRR